MPVFVSKFPYPLYYVSGYAYHLLEKLFAEKELPPQYKTYRFHLMMLFRLLTETSELPYMNSKKIEKYCSDIKDILWDDKKAIAVFQKGVEIIEQVLPSITYDEYEAVRRKIFTTELINRVSLVKTNKPASKTTSSPATEEKERGFVVSFSEIRGYGFIKGKHEQNIFVYYKDIVVDNKLDFRYLLPNEEVEFVVVQTPKGLLAKKVKVIKKKQEKH